MLSLQNAFLAFLFNPDTGTWSVRSQQWVEAAVTEARVDANLCQPKEPHRCAPAALAASQPAEPRVQDSLHGRLTTVSASAQLAGELGRSVQLDIEFALPEARPFLLWRVTARNRGSQLVALNTLDLLAAGPRFSKGALRLAAVPGQWAFFSNGYQSWSFAGALQADMRQPLSIFGGLGNPKRLNLATPGVYQRGHFTSEMFGAVGDRTHRVGLVLGFLSQCEQFGHVEAYLDTATPSLRLAAQCDGVLLPPGGARTTDWAYLQFVALADPDPLGEYMDAAARQAQCDQICAPQHTPVGWCSWYHYFDRVTEQNITANLEALAREQPRLPLDFVQLDDGFQKNIGDWFELNAKFPHGLPWLTEQIRARGHTPGLWLAPYIVRQDAQLRSAHPDWFLRDARGRLANAGFNWSQWCYGLDVTHPAVREHTRRLITTAVQTWGFPYLKLDFLYAAALPARRYDPTLTRAQVMRLALTDIRQAAGPEVFLLGCGCPLGSAIGLVNGMRIGTDVAPDWWPDLVPPVTHPFLRHEMEYPSARNAIRNTLQRAAMHRRWWLNDPDCLLARDHATRLTETEVCSLATVIALSGGMFLVSDDMTQLNPERQRYIAPLLPALKTSARPLDWLATSMPDVFRLPLSGPPGDWLVLGVFNWAERRQTRELDLGELGLDRAGAYFVSDFWERKIWRQAGAAPLRLENIPRHGACLLALRRILPAAPTLVASSFHFSQGGELSDWQAEANGLRLTMELGRVAYGELRLALPAKPHSVTVDGRRMPATALADGIYSTVFAVNRAAEVKIGW